MYVEASLMTSEMSPIWKNNPATEYFLPLFYGMKVQNKAANKPWPSAEPSDENTVVRTEVGQLIARLKADCGWEKWGEESLC